jgi:hypothetical protein
MIFWKLMCFVQYSEEKVLKILNDEKKSVENNTIDLSKKIFDNHFFEEDFCFCVFQKQIIEKTLENIFNSLSDNFLKREFLKKNIKEYFKIKKMCKKIYVLLSQNECVALKMKILINYCKKLKIKIKFQIFFQDFFFIFLRHNKI